MKLYISRRHMYIESHYSEREGKKKALVGPRAWLQLRNDKNNKGPVIKETIIIVIMADARNAQ